MDGAQRRTSAPGTLRVLSPRGSASQPTSPLRSRLSASREAPWRRAEQEEQAAQQAPISQDRIAEATIGDSIAPAFAQAAQAAIALVAAEQQAAAAGGSPGRPRQAHMPKGAARLQSLGAHSSAGAMVSFGGRSLAAESDAAPGSPKSTRISQAASTPTKSIGRRSEGGVAGLMKHLPGNTVESELSTGSSRVSVDLTQVSCWLGCSLQQAARDGL